MASHLHSTGGSRIGKVRSPNPFIQINEVDNVDTVKRNPHTILQFFDCEPVTFQRLFKRGCRVVGDSTAGLRSLRQEVNSDIGDLLRREGFCKFGHG